MLLSGGKEWISKGLAGLMSRSDTQTDKSAPMIPQYSEIKTGMSWSIPP